MVICILSAIVAMVRGRMEKLQKSGHEESLIKENIHYLVEVSHSKESFGDVFEFGNCWSYLISENVITHMGVFVLQHLCTIHKTSIEFDRARWSHEIF